MMALVCAPQVVWGKSNQDLPYMWESMESSDEAALFELGDKAGLENFQVCVCLAQLTCIYTTKDCQC